MARLNWIIFVQNVQKITLEVNADDKIDYLLAMDSFIKVPENRVEFKVRIEFEIRIRLGYPNLSLLYI